MFSNIAMVDYSRPLPERKESRKHVGPYRWTPTEPGGGRSFYQASHGLAMDERGSSFRLRLTEANDFLRGSRLADITGYYINGFQDETIRPIVAALPRGRGFLPGWTMGSSMLASLDLDIYETAEEAARAAHSMAENDAERMREDDEETDATTEEPSHA